MSRLILSCDYLAHRDDESGLYFCEVITRTGPSDRELYARIYGKDRAEAKARAVLLVRDVGAGERSRA
jgi:hypothetical protein